MASDCWKAHERETAKRLGGVRAGPTGKIGSDVLHRHLAIECKERATPVKWLEDALVQSTKAAKPEQLPIVVVHWKGQRHNNDIVMIRLSKYEEWFGDVGKGEGDDDSRQA